MERRKWEVGVDQFCLGPRKFHIMRHAGEGTGEAVANTSLAIEGEL